MNVSFKESIFSRITFSTNLLIALLAIVTIAACSKPAQQAQPNVFTVTTVETSDRTLQDFFGASISGRQDVRIIPQVSGAITKVCVSEGQEVKKGQSLFIIDQVPYKAALRTAEASVEVAKAAVSTAQLSFNSTKILFEKKVVSSYDLTMAKNALLTAKAQLAQAEAVAVNAKNNLSYSLVKSSSDGVVGAIPFRVGTLVGPSMTTPLTTVSDNSAMYVYFSMSEREMLTLTRQYGSIKEALKSMPPVKLQLIDGSLYEEEGHIEAISGVIDAATGSVSVRAVFPNEKHILLSGGTGRVIVPYQRANCIVIDQNATFELQDKIYAFKVVDGKAVSAMLTVDPINNGKEYIVTNGLKVGDVIVTEGTAMLRNDMPIQTKQVSKSAKH
ncbi:MAG: efflux RND transporter periplasmic adaptor subunit [Bacteroidaceae bacterium]